MRVLVIGYGSMGRRHAANARELGHEVVVLDLSVDAEQAALDDDFPILIGSAIHHDAIVVSTPASTHYQLASGLRGRGYFGPLFVEKPLDITTEHAKFWRSWPHPVKWVGYNLRFQYQMGGMLIARCNAGPHKRVSMELCCDMATWPGSNYASPLLECSHEIDLLRCFCGESLKSASVTDRTAQLAFGGGCRVLLDWDAREYRRRWVYETERFGAVASFASPEALDIERTYLDEMSFFLAAAEGEKPVSTAATFEDGLAVVEICEEAMRMAEEVA